VHVGAFTRLDRYAVEHWMPWLRPSHPRLIHLHTLVVPETRHTLGGTLVGLWTFPASPVVSALLVGSAALALDRRARRREAVSWCAVWVVGNAIELATKLSLSRPRLDAVSGFDNSFPSGHTLRAFLVAAALAAAWPRLRVAYLWALGVPFALVVLGDHTPTDVVGGALLASALIAARFRTSAAP